MKLTLSWIRNHFGFEQGSFQQIGNWAESDGEEQIGGCDARCIGGDLGGGHDGGQDRRWLHQSRQECHFFVRKQPSSMDHHTKVQFSTCITILCHYPECYRGRPLRREYDNRLRFRAPEVRVHPSGGGNKQSFCLSVTELVKINFRATNSWIWLCTEVRRVSRLRGQVRRGRVSGVVQGKGHVPLQGAGLI